MTNGTTTATVTATPASGTVASVQTSTLASLQAIVTAGQAAAASLIAQRTALQAQIATLNTQITALEGPEVAKAQAQLSQLQRFFNRMH